MIIALVCLSIISAGAIITTLLIALALRSTVRQSNELLWALSNAKDESARKLVETAVQALIAKSASEVVEADGLRKQWDIANQNLADAYAEAAGAAKRKEPHWATTQDGRQIDLNDFDIVM